VTGLDVQSENMFDGNIIGYLYIYQLHIYLSYACIANNVLMTSDIPAKNQLKKGLPPTLGALK
jgi:hypothetical protein